MDIRRVLTILVLLGALVLPLAGQDSGDTYRFAYDQGFSDGEISGRADRRNNEGYDYSKWPEFLLADRGFDAGIHDPEVYGVAYRRGFKDGYENGYNNPVPDLRRDSPLHGGEGDGETVPSAGSPGWVIAGGTVITVRLLDPLSTEMNHEGDNFLAELAESVKLSESFSLPEGTRIHGTISRLKRAGRIRGRAEMELHFNRIEINRGYSLSLNAEMVGLVRDPRNPVESENGTVKQNSGVKEDAGRIGTSTGIGALIGVITGGVAGAGKGAVVGAAGGLVGTILTRGDDINLLTETEIIIQLVDDITIPKDRLE